MPLRLKVGMTYNARSPAVKRLMKEAQELSEPTELFHAQPLEDNLFEWHFTIRGPSDTDFGDGVYHGRIILPTEYPMKPPNILLLTPNGRFDVNKKICLSISGYHPESWRPSWSIRTALLAIIGFMPTHGSGAIGSLDYPSEERKRLAKLSQSFRCSNCGETKSILLPLTEASTKDREEAKDLAKQISFQAEKQKTSTTSESSDANPGSPISVDAPASVTTAAAAGVLPPPPPYSNFVAEAASSAPNNMMPMFSGMWSYPSPYSLPVGQPMLPGNSGQPLSFIDWLTQVKGYTPMNQSSQPSSSVQPPVAAASAEILTTQTSANNETSVVNGRPSSPPMNPQPEPAVTSAAAATPTEPPTEPETTVRHRSPAVSPHVHAAPPMNYDSASFAHSAEDARGLPSAFSSALLKLLYVIMAFLGLLLARRCFQTIF